MNLQEDTPLNKNLIYDIGQHKGEDTGYYLKKGFKVIAFEADPDLAEDNRKRFSSAINQEQLILVEGAIVKDPTIESIQFYKNLDNTVWGTVDPDWASRNDKMGTNCKAIEVKTIDFRKCLKTYGIPYYMKIDIEGADGVCLETLNHFKAKPYYLSIESEKVDFEVLKKELSLLKELGYNLFAAVQQAYTHKIQIPDPPGEGAPVAHIFPKDASGLFGRDIRETWKSEAEIVKEYEKIFLTYRKYGDATFWQQNIIAKKLLKLFSSVTGNPIPGWYDTHAKHSSCKH